MCTGSIASSPRNIKAFATIAFHNQQESSTSNTVEFDNKDKAAGKLSHSKYPRQITCAKKKISLEAILAWIYVSVDSQGFASQEVATKFKITTDYIAMKQ